MTHFMALVLTREHDGVAAALAPFQENNTGACDREFLAFEDLGPEGRSLWETGTESRWIMPDGRLLTGREPDFENRLDALDAVAFDRTDEAGRRSRAPLGWCRRGSEIVIRVVPEGAVQQEIPIRDLHPDFAVWMNRRCGAPDGETGLWGRWHNPNARWDGWSHGGRYGGRLLVPQGTEGGVAFRGCLMRGTARAANASFDQARLGDIDRFAILEEARRLRGEEWDNFAGMEDPDLRRFLTGGCGREAYQEAAVDPLIPHALVHDGVWRERGPDCRESTPAWQAWVGEVNALLRDLPGDLWVSVIDCHR